ncbi:armadillo-type protein [Protomyces lactucae-debilis]|uniref:26S proteasome regulatory subunit RPN2 n=1 Tax=Protomyces lactucae-debilis TaxID=2754530 RepID=A0A1Y2FQB6_PROLT|nr:armadillo-type protein [Protomyces lactucae-debilis]ORY86168.1 armadillo-type protein [Protomyces lactucae-debilis]
MVAITSPSGLLALLNDSNVELQSFALTKLNEIVDASWPEISDDITSLEILYEDESFANRRLAALVASKVYYHLGEYAQSTDYALGAGDLFDLKSHDEYVETIIAHCIDSFIAENAARYSEGDKAGKADSRLSEVVSTMLQQCYRDKEFKQAIGIALESKRLDILETIIGESKDDNLLPYILETCIATVSDLKFRDEVTAALLEHLNNQMRPDYPNIIKCIVMLDDDAKALKILLALSAAASDNGKEDELAIANVYQCAFDIEAMATRSFLSSLISKLQAEDGHEQDEGCAAIRKNLVLILSGTKTIQLHLEFLYRNNHADIAILDKIKNSLEARNSIFHSAVTFANAFMHAGTTSDGFFRNNLDWLSKASNWSKFSATAALGVIHKGNLNQSMTLLGPYLPQEGANGSVYSEGGSLYALGLIHANHGAESLPFLTEQFARATEETVQHGAALGLGAAGLATCDADLYDRLRTVLFHDSAVAGEACGLSMGLVMLGTGNEDKIDEMLQYAHETQHEKIIRGLAMGIAMMLYGCERAADAYIERLVTDDNPILRHGGIFGIAMAYCGTGNTAATEKLLHFAVSDVHDDVRRAAVMCLGFVMFKNPQGLCRTIDLLYESYNPHVRYGAAMAVGIACAGTALPEALDILNPMTHDATDFVRQGAYIATAMVLIQHNDQTNPESVELRKLYSDVISNKHSDAVTKFGAAVGSGILDAGGRNVTLRLQSYSGGNNMPAVVGMAIFTQLWYWFPLGHFLSLAFTPTAMIGVNKDLNVPAMVFRSNAMPIMFAYTPETPKEDKKAAEKVETAVLSTTMKAKARAKKQEKEKEDAMETDEKAETPAPEPESMDTDKAAEEGEKKPDATETAEGEADADTAEGTAPKKEPLYEILGNMSRVVPWQLKHIHFKSDARYYPARKPAGGILFLRDRRPKEEESLLDMQIDQSPPAPPAAAAGPDSAMEVDDEEEAPLPLPFDYDGLEDEA